MDLLDSTVIPCAHNNDFLVSYSDPSHYFRVGKGSSLNSPPFRFTTNISDTSPYIAEFHIFDLTLSDSGSYLILIYGDIPTSDLFNLTVRRKCCSELIFKYNTSIVMCKLRVFVE